MEEEPGADAGRGGDACAEAAAPGVPQHEERVLAGRDRQQRGEKREARDVELHLRPRQPLPEEAEDLVERLARGLARAVDQVRRHHAVRLHLGADAFAVRRRVGQHAPDEAVAERLLVGGEALGLAERIAREAVGEHGQVLALHARLHGGELVGRDVHAAGLEHRQRRLREHRREHRRLEHHREREVAGEAHADRADAVPAAERMRVRGERAQPVVTGLDSFAAKARNSRLTHARSIVPSPRGIEMARPGSPKSCGIQTVKPASRTQRAKRATCG